MHKGVVNKVDVLSEGGQVMLRPAIFECWQEQSNNAQTSRE